MKSITRRKLYDIVVGALRQSNLSDSDRTAVLAAVENPENKVVGVGGSSMRHCPLGLAGFWSDRVGFTLSEGSASSFYGLFDQAMDRALGDAGDTVRILDEA